MKRQSTDSVALAARLRAFMEGAGWSNTRSTRGLSFFSPPASLGIKGKYTIALPDDPARSSVSGFIFDAADALSQIYGYGQVGDLLDRAASLSDFNRPSRIVSRFSDEETRGGAIPLPAIGSYVSNIESALYRTAKFRLGDDSKAADLKAKAFAQECYFLQTSVGSFIATVEIPPTILSQGDLFDDQLDSTGVTSSLHSAIDFVNDRVLGTDTPFDDPDTLANAISLFDVELLTSISNAILGPELASIEFSFEIGQRVRTTSTGWISAERRERLSEFVAFFTERLRGEDRIDVVGSIVELRSRDPEGDRNHIRVAAEFYGDRTFFTATLTNIQYQYAVDAHRSKRPVRMVGRGIRLQTQVRMTFLERFE